MPTNRRGIQMFEHKVCEILAETINKFRHNHFVGSEEAARFANHLLVTNLSVAEYRRTVVGLLQLIIEKEVNYG